MIHANKWRTMGFVTQIAWYNFVTFKSHSMAFVVRYGKLWNKWKRLDISNLESTNKKKKEIWCRMKRNKLNGIATHKSLLSLVKCNSTQFRTIGKNVNHLTLFLIYPHRRLKNRNTAFIIIYYSRNSSELMTCIQSINITIDQLDICVHMNFIALFVGRPHVLTTTIDSLLHNNCLLSTRIYRVARIQTLSRKPKIEGV